MVSLHKGALELKRIARHPALQTKLGRHQGQQKTKMHGQFRTRRHPKATESLLKSSRLSKIYDTVGAPEDTPR